MGELHLEPAFGSGRALSEDLENEAGAIYHLRLRGVLEILLLDRADRPVDDEKVRFRDPQLIRDFLDLPLPEQRRGTRLTDLEGDPLGNLYADCPGKPLGLVEPRVDVPPSPVANIGQGDERARAAGEFVSAFTLESGQAPGSWPSSIRLTGFSG